MIVVSNASPLANLSAIGQFDLLHRLHRRLHIAEGVWAELNAGGERWLGCDDVAEAGWIERHAVQSQVLVAAGKCDLDRGEAEAITVTAGLRPLAVR